MANGLSFPTSLEVTSVFGTKRTYGLNKGMAVSKVPSLLTALSWTGVPSFVNAGSFGTLPVAGTVPTATVVLGVGEAKVYVRATPVSVVGGAVATSVPFTVSGTWEYLWSVDVSNTATTIPAVNFFGTWSTGTANLSVAPLAIGSKRRLYIRTKSADGLNYNVYGIDFAGVADENSITSLVLERQLFTQDAATVSNTYFTGTKSFAVDVLNDITGTISTGTAMQLAVANNSVTFSGLFDYANVIYKVKTGASNFVLSTNATLSLPAGFATNLYAF